MSTNQNVSTATGNDKILALARKRFRLTVDAESTLRANMLADQKFAAGDQWDPVVQAQRTENGDPCLVIDILNPQIKQITNQQRNMRPAIEVVAVNNGADPDTAEAFQGVIRHIEQQSNADDAYDTAGKDQTEIGRGWFRILTEYADDADGENTQEIKIKRVRNPFSIYPDPQAQEKDYSDGKYLFETSDWLPEDLQARYPNAKATGDAHFSALGDDAAHWLIGERRRVALYWVISSDRVDATLAPGSKKAKPARPTVTCYAMTGTEILETYEWAGKYIPYVPVIGEEVVIDGKVDYRGVVRRAKDPQRAFNYQKSKIAEVMALAPLAPWVAQEGQLENYEADWKASNRKKIPVLFYKAVGLGGAPAPPPQRNFGEPPIQAMMAQAAAAQNEVRQATGFYDVSDGTAKDQSGRAIVARQQQGEHGNSDYIDGLARAIRYAGRILVDLIPKIYDAPRVLRILGIDRQPQTIMVHAGKENAPPAGEPLPDGVKAVYDLGVGMYDVAVNAGPAYRTARKEFTAQLADLFKADPPLMQIIGDLYFENLDIPEGKQIAERLRKVQDPRLRDDQPGDPGAVAQQAHQLAGQVQQLQGQLQQAQQAIATDQAKQQAQIQIKQLDIAWQREKAQADNETKITVAELGAKVDRLALFMDERARLGLAQADSQAAAVQNAHAVGMAALGHVHGQLAADANVARQPDPAEEQQAA